MSLEPQTKPARRLNYAERQREAIKAGTVERKPRQRIKAVSAKRAREGAEYLKLRAEFLEENPICQVTGCRAEACDVHHKARRGKFLLRVDTFLACCRLHHTHIEDNPEWSKHNGFILTAEQKRAIT